jgi:hypothetical protein
MKVLNPEEEQEYCDFTDAIAVCVLRESVKLVKQFNENNVNPMQHAQEISVAMGQVALDVIIEMTKDMDKEKFTRLFAEIAIANVVNAMERHPEYKKRIGSIIGFP